MASLISTMYSPSPGHLVVEDRVGVEAEVVGVRHLVALGVVEGQGGLEPAGHGVGQVGHQVRRALAAMTSRWPCGPVKRNRSTLAGQDLAVDHDRQRDGHLAARPLLRGVGSGAVLDVHRLRELGQLADAEHQRIGQPAGVPSRSSRRPGSASAATVTCSGDDLGDGRLVGRRTNVASSLRRWPAGPHLRRPRGLDGRRRARLQRRCGGRRLGRAGLGGSCLRADRGAVHRRRSLGLQLLQRIPQALACCCSIGLSYSTTVTLTPPPETMRLVHAVEELPAHGHLERRRPACRRPDRRSRCAGF